MNCASARCRRAIWPFITVKREPLSLTPISKSRPSGSPRSTWSFTREVELARRAPLAHFDVAVLRRRPAARFRAAGWARPAAAPASRAGSAPAARPTAPVRPWPAPLRAITASADSPLDLSWPICLDSVLRAPAALRCGSGWSCVRLPGAGRPPRPGRAGATCAFPGRATTTGQVFAEQVDVEHRPIVFCGPPSPRRQFRLAGSRLAPQMMRQTFSSARGV
jgi:hypothetical protein